MFEGFIFDVEVTLLDSVAQNQHSLQDALKKFGYRVPIYTLRLYPGLDGDQALQLVVPDASDRERTAILEDRRQIYERDYHPSVKPLEGARDVIRILAEQGGRIALASDCKGLSFTRHMLLLDSRDHITATACGDDLEHGKPDPRLVGIALRKAGYRRFAGGHGRRHAVRCRRWHRGRHEGCQFSDRRVFRRSARQRRLLCRGA